MKEYIVTEHPDFPYEEPKPQELIRCKDCLYWQDNNGGYPHEDCKWKGDETPDDDDFCSGAEGKE